MEKPKPRVNQHFVELENGEVVERGNIWAVITATSMPYITVRFEDSSEDSYSIDSIDWNEKEKRWEADVS